ncbi:MAG: type II secretion system protein [Lentisphaeria bacterium]|nr:type II secretion system protein [Lentisphaeria bacterium]
MKKFTLVELVICVACVAVLATVFISAAGATGAAKAEEAACAARQKNIYAALNQYAADNAGFYPYFDDEFAIPGCKTRITWGYRIHKYLPQETGNRNFFCPSQQALYPEIRNRSRATSPESCVVAPERNLERYRSINYGINFEYVASNLGGWAGKNTRDYITVNTAKIVNAAQKVLTADAWNGTNQARYVISSYHSGSNKMNPCHENAANVLWCDGHVSRVDNPHATLQDGKHRSNFRVDK